MLPEGRADLGRRRGRFHRTLHYKVSTLKTKVLDKREYLKELARLQVELVRLQEWIVHEGLKVVVLFEGRDTAGKGGVIRRISERTNPRVVRTVALGKPSDRERTQWYFQRYVAHLPAAGEMVLFDRSWYNRAGVERVMGFCTDGEYAEFMRTCPQFERSIQRAGIALVKYWLSVSDAEQERRFEARLRDPAKRWKLSPVDVEARARWVDYAEAKDEMFAYTDTKESPWFVVEADDKRTARLNLIPTCSNRSPTSASTMTRSSSRRARNAAMFALRSTLRPSSPLAIGCSRNRRAQKASRPSIGQLAQGTGSGRGLTILPSAAPSQVTRTDTAAPRSAC